MPELTGNPILLRALPNLRAHRGKLLSADAGGRGKAVHAASFLRKREIVLETELLAHRNNLRLIVTHEIFHFVWWHLGNALRREFRSLLESELGAGARGELGESAGVHKRVLGASELSWRDYVCESFCDSAAWMYAGRAKPNGGGGLAKSWRQKRRRWFESVFARPRRC